MAHKAGGSKQREPEQGLPHPVLQAMLVCDQAIREAATNKITLIGIFDRASAAEFPLHWLRPTTVYSRVTDAEGTYNVRLDLVRLEDEQTVGRTEGQVRVESRMGSGEILFDLDNVLVFERPGRYEFRLFAESRYVGGIILTVLQAV